MPERIEDREAQIYKSRADRGRVEGKHTTTPFPPSIAVNAAQP